MERAETVQDEVQREEPEDEEEPEEPEDGAEDPSDVTVSQQVASNYYI